MSKLQRMIDALVNGHAKECTWSGAPALKIVLKEPNGIREIYLLAEEVDVDEEEPDQCPEA